MRRTVIVVAGIFLAGASVMAEDSPAPETSVTQTLLTPRDDIPGVKNFAKVSDGLYRGEQPTAEGFAELKKMGVKTVVNLRSFHSDRSMLAGTGLHYVHFFCKAWHPEDEDVAKFLKVLKDPNNRPVFVHCMHGSDRTGMMVAAYRMLEQGWSPDDAARETHNFGFHMIFEEIQTYLKHFNAVDMGKAVEATVAPDIDTVK